jgi:hypothetical protein
MTAQHAAYLLLAALALAAWAYFRWEVRHAIDGDAHGMESSADVRWRQFRESVDRCRADFEPAETPLLDRDVELMAPQVIAEAEALLEMGR